jgi:beta-glucosidase
MNGQIEVEMSDVEQRVEQLLQQLTLTEKVALLSGKDAWNTVPIARLGIPSLTFTDGPHGARRPTPTTAFPTGTALAATWNPQLIEQVGKALAEETLAMNCDVLLGPCVNIIRHPLGGRNFETYSEDPYLAGRIGVAWVQGLQSKGVGASLKHFACNNQETERMRVNSVVDERTLREIYLAQFEMIVKEAKPWTVMCSYNRLNGVYASEHRHLLTEILKGEWNFDGVVISDWSANHTTTESVKNGLDLEMPGPARYYGRLLVEAVELWQIEIAAIDDAARRILRMLVRSGRLDAPRPQGSANTPAHQQLARAVAAEAITLLKNDDALLPLKLDTLKSIAVIGPNASDWQITGGGSSRVEPPYRVTPLDALKNKIGARVRVEYAQGCDHFADPPRIQSDWLTPSQGSGHGLTLELFANTDCTGTPVDTTVMPTLDYFVWDDGTHPRISFARFSARWSGTLTVPETGLYTIKINHSSFARVYVDDRQVIESDRLSSSPRDSAEIELTGGHAHTLRVEFVKRTDENYAFVRLGLARRYRTGEDTRLARAVELAQRSDVALVFVGLPEDYETESADRPNMELTNAQNDLVRAIARANRRTIVVMNAGAPVTMPWLDDVRAVVWGYYTGQEAGNALADVLCGDVNPSGKLPMTLPKRLQDTPAFTNYPGARDVYYGEGIFVGYRWYDARDIAPLFPFGHGLSYTTFEYSALRVPAYARVGESVEISLTVKNTGAMSGKEVVQVYVRDVQSSLARPPKELKQFAKIELKPGEAQTLRLTLDARAFAFYDPYTKRWTVEPGEFEILVGSSSRDIRLRWTVKMQVQ